MIIKHSVKNHSVHKDEILERIERFKSYYNTKMPSDYVRQTGERIHLDTVHSDLHVHDILKPHLDYVFTEVLHEPMNQIGQHSRDHQAAEDEDYMKSVFDQYSTPAKDKRGNPTGVDIITKDKATEASKEIIMKWNELPE